MKSIKRKHSACFLISLWFWVGIPIFFSWIPCAADEDEKAFSGELRVEGGSFQAPGTDLSAYQISRLELESHLDVAPNFTMALEGDAKWQASTATTPPPEPEFPVGNLIPVEISNSNGPFYSFELYQASLHFTSGRLDVTGGLFKPNWGSSHFYKPTDYFFPIQPLQWQKDPPESSDGLDATFFLFDDLSLEGAGRLLDGGNGEWVLRLVNKGIGITVTPSFVSMLGRNGMGVELSGTFPDFQLRVEGVDWLFPDGTARAEWVAGVSTLRQGIAYSVEIYRDETGGVLGDFSAGTVNATYFYTSIEKTFPGDWKISPALVKGIEGGPFLFWPKASWGFEKSWELDVQGQLKIGTVPGPLALVPNRLGLSITYSF